MRAAVMSRVGPPEDAFDIREVDKPIPIATEVLVAIRATGTNPVEAAIRSGTFPLLAPPAILGWDLSGVVEEVVPGVTRFKVGDEVYGMPFFPRAAHTYAEYVAAPSRQLARKPVSLDHVHAAALPLVGLTAWQSLVDAARVTPGQRVLIHGAGGGVGHVAVQIAKALGAEVIATTSAEKRDFVRALGADQVIDYWESDFTKVARDIDVVLELIGKDYGDRSLVHRS
jgi:NADPH:quinone reductase-like Zn-dependent oxidoreductase